MTNVVPNQAPGVVRFDIQRKSVKRSPGIRDQARRKLRKRDSTLQVTLDNEEALYFANVTLGTPGQDLRLDIDTGSSDVWMFETGYCDKSTTQQCLGFSCKFIVAHER